MSARGIHLTCVDSAIDGLIEFGHTRPTAVVIASDACDLSASEFVTRVRQRAVVPIVAVMDPDDPTSAGELLLAGASATIARPYSAAVLWDVLEKLHRGLDDQVKITFGPLELDARAYTVTVAGVRIGDLPLKEFELLRALMYQAPDVVTNEELRTTVWGGVTGGPSENTIRVHVARLRSHLASVANIRRVRGRGYALTLR